MSALNFSLNAPIGVFDSGLGGLSLMRQIERYLPSESVLYLADTANVPYGDKPLSVVRALALTLTEILIERGCKMVIMASGTSTAAGLEAAIAHFPGTPILGTIEAGARAAVKGARPLGVIATAATARSQAFTHAVHALDPHCPILEVGCPRFVPLVETGQADSADALAACGEYLQPLMDAGVQTTILGCTHFPFLLPALNASLKASNYAMRFVDPAEEAVCEAKALLTSLSLLAPEAPPGKHHFEATGDPQDFALQASVLHATAAPIRNAEKLVLDTDTVRVYNTL